MFAICSFTYFVMIDAVICRFGECDLRSVDCRSEPFKSNSNICISGFFHNFTAAASACRQQFGQNYSLVSPGDAATNIELFAACNDQRTMLGIVRSDSCSQWLDKSSQQPVFFFNWNTPIEPNNNLLECPPLQEGCTLLLESSIWADVRCFRDSNVWNSYSCAACGSRKTKSTPAPAPASSALPVCPLDDQQSVGCFCDNGCVAGRWSSSLNAVVSTPLTEWKFDRNRTSLLDSSGNGFHSTIRGPLVFRQENGVAYLHCHGANDVINFPNTTFDGFGLRNFAFEAKLRFTSTDLMIISAKRSNVNGDGDEPVHWVVFAQDGRLVIEIEDSTIRSNRTFNDYAWHTLRAERRNGVCSLFVDGKLDGTGACSHSIADGTRFSLLSHYWSNDSVSRWIGDVASVSLYVDNTLGSGSLCSRDSSSGRFQQTDKLVCRSGVSGFCLPSSPSRKCCGVANCASCDRDFNQCDVTTTTVARTTSTTTTTTTVASSSSLFTSSTPTSTTSTTALPPSTTPTTPTTLQTTVTSSTSSTQEKSLSSFVANVSVDNTVTIGVAVGVGVAVLLLIIVVVVVVVARKKRTTAPNDQKATEVPMNQPRSIAKDAIYAYGDIENMRSARADDPPTASADYGSAAFITPSHYSNPRSD